MTHIEKQCIETLTRVLRLRKLKPKNFDVQLRLFWIDFHYQGLLKEMFRLDQWVKNVQEVNDEIKKLNLEDRDEKQKR